MAENFTAFLYYPQKPVACDKTGPKNRLTDQKKKR